MNGSTPGITLTVLQDASRIIVGAIIPQAPQDVQDATANEVAQFAGMAIARLLHTHRAYSGVNDDRDASGLTAGDRARGDTAASVLGDNTAPGETNATAPQTAPPANAPPQQAAATATAAPTAAAGSSDQATSAVVGSIPRQDAAADASRAADAAVAAARAGGTTDQQPPAEGGVTVPVGAAPERAAGTPETPLPTIAADRTVAGGYTPPDSQRDTTGDAARNAPQEAAAAAGREQVNTGAPQDITSTQRNALDDAAAGGAIVDQPPAEGGALDTTQLAADAGGTVVEQPPSDGGAVREPVAEPGTVPPPAPAHPVDDAAAFAAFVTRMRAEYPAIAAQIDREVAAAAATANQGAANAPQQ